NAIHLNRSELKYTGQCGNSFGLESASFLNQYSESLSQNFEPPIPECDPDIFSFNDPIYKDELSRCPDDVDAELTSCASTASISTTCPSPSLMEKSPSTMFFEPLRSPPAFPTSSNLFTEYPFFLNSFPANTSPHSTFQFPKEEYMPTCFVPSVSQVNAASFHFDPACLSSLANGDTNLYQVSAYPTASNAAPPLLPKASSTSMPLNTQDPIIPLSSRAMYQGQAQANISPSSSDSSVSVGLNENDALEFHTSKKSFSPALANHNPLQAPNTTAIQVNKFNSGTSSICLTSELFPFKKKDKVENPKNSDAIPSSCNTLQFNSQKTFQTSQLQVDSIPAPLLSDLGNMNMPEKK
ncbi:hypothetical protein HMI55_004061, partial [Coelomomyces lativittatus]